MSNRFYLSVLLLCTTVFASSQNRAVRYSGTIAGGLLAGESSSALQVQLVNGVQVGTWSAGLGLGLDEYKARSIPVFLQVQKRAKTKPETPFGYIDLGVTIPELKEEEKLFVLDQKTGFFGEGGVGYELPVLHNKRIFFSGGWRVKTYTLKVNAMPYISVWPLPESAIRLQKYTLTSISIKAGLRF